MTGWGWEPVGPIEKGIEVDRHLVLRRTIRERRGRLREVGALTSGERRWALPRVLGWRGRDPDTGERHKAPRQATEQRCTSDWPKLNLCQRFIGIVVEHDARSTGENPGREDPEKFEDETDAYDRDGRRPRD